MIPQSVWEMNQTNVITDFVLELIKIIARLMNHKLVCNYGRIVIGNGAKSYLPNGSSREPWAMHYIHLK